MIFNRKKKYIYIYGLYCYLRECVLYVDIGFFKKTFHMHDNNIHTLLYFIYSDFKQKVAYDKNGLETFFIPVNGDVQFVLLPKMFIGKMLYDICQNV